jgi:glycosyltransferase involved in cell wall biosynthesis
MKKLIFISIDPAAGSRRILNQINTAKSIFSVEVITISNKQTPTIEGGGIDFHYIALKNRLGVKRFLEFNLKVLRLLWQKKIDIISCRGLWVFPAVIPLRLFKNFKIIYDAHEYFAGHTHFDNKPLKRRIWLSIEKRAMKIIDTLITVSEPIADEYKKDYPFLDKIYVIRNLPMRSVFRETKDGKEIEKQLKADSKNGLFNAVFSGYLLPGRALENIIRAFALIKEEKIRLWIIGEGILRQNLYQLHRDLNLEKKITFSPMVANNEIVPLLANFSLGLSLIEADCLNRSFALPNKLFEYIAAGIPVLASDIITQKFYLDKYRVGRYINPDDPQTIADAITEIYQNIEQRKIWRKNCLAASEELNWEKESHKLKKIYERFI